MTATCSGRNAPRLAAFHGTPFSSAQRTVSVPLGPGHVAAQCSTDIPIIPSEKRTCEPCWTARSMPAMSPCCAQCRRSAFGSLSGSLRGRVKPRELTIHSSRGTHSKKNLNRIFSALHRRDSEMRTVTDGHTILSSQGGGTGSSSIESTLEVPVMVPERSLVGGWIITICHGYRSSLSRTSVRTPDPGHQMSFRVVSRRPGASSGVAS